MGYIVTPRPPTSSNFIPPPWGQRSPLRERGKSGDRARARERARGKYMATEGGLIKGLEGVVAAESALCDLDGASGRLAYRGYDIAELAGQASFEEGLHLPWDGGVASRGRR